MRSLHTGELPLRQVVIVELDGPNLSDNTLSGPIRQLLNSATELSAKVIEDLLTDQHYGYHIVSAVRDGMVPARLALLEIGPANHSRWLITANRLLRLWVSKHGLRGLNQKKKTAIYCGIHCWSVLSVNG